MKILMATMQLDIGGAETHIVELSKQLVALGHEVIIISNGGVYVSEIESVGIRHVSAPLHRRSVGDMMRSRAILKETIRRERPDVIHAHARIPAFLCGTLAKRMGVPFVTSCHGVYAVSRVLKLLSNWGERTLAVSEDIRDYLVEQYGVSPAQITMTINGIDTEKFSPAVSGERVRREFSLGDGPVVCHVSRLDQETKTAALQLIEIAPRLHEAVPGVRLLIVGGGTAFEELRGLAEKTNETLGFPCITLTGPRTDINELVAAGDLFVGVSRAALEAMAAEKPTVLSGAQGHMGLFLPAYRERAMETNFCCRTDPVSTPDQLLGDVVRGLSLSGEERQTLGKFGRSVVQEHFSLERMVRDSLAVYDQVRLRRYNVVMSGYYGFNNAGDDAILESVRENIRAISDDVSLTVLSRDPELTLRQFGLHAVPRFHIFKVAAALRKGDLLLSGGGSLMQDTTSTRSLLYYLSVIWLACLMGKPVMFYANGIGPVRQKMNRRMVRHAVERAAAVTLRDHSSCDELRTMGVKRDDLLVTADPVFRLEPDSRERALELIGRSGIPMDRPFVIVSVRDWDKAVGFPEQLAPVCDHLRRSHGLEVLFLLMQPKNDSEMTRRVREAMEEPSYLLEGGCSPREIMAVLGEAKLCLAMRLHTLIFAAKVATPTVGLVYDPKVESYLRELGLPSSGDVERYDSTEAITVCDRLMADYDHILENVREKSRRLYENSQRNDTLLLELLRQTKS